MTPGKLWQRLSEAAVPKLWLPKRENVYQVESLPMLGAGKLELMAVKARAQQLAGACAVESAS